MYDFKQLSPADFEELTRDLLQAEWNVRLESFKAGRDNGIDLRYAEATGPGIIVQCKHFASSNVAKLVHQLRTDELPKITKLNPKRYVIVTSLPLNPTDKSKIADAVHPYLLDHSDVIGAGDLNNLLGRHNAVEKAHFKLWLSSMAVLQRVLHNAAHTQTQFEVEKVRKAIPLYVQTTAYTRAMKILDENRFVIVTGVPGIGKTTLANMLLYAHLAAKYQPVVIKSMITEGKDLFNPEIAQIFYFDDFLGETFLGKRHDFLATKQDSSILDFIDQVAASKKSRFILTTREHVLQHAYHISEHFRRQRGNLIEHRCILELSDYSLLDKGRILYNHIFFSDLPRAYKDELLEDAFYFKILKHRNPNPRLIEWISKYTHLKHIDPSKYKAEITRVLENPEQLWEIAYNEQISDSARSIVLALYSLGGEADLDRLEQVWRDLHHHRARKYNWKMAPDDFRRSLRDLEGGFLSLDYKSAKFVNPSVKDFLDATLVQHEENVEDLLASASSFEQIHNIWSLAESEKGQSLTKYLNKYPDQLLVAIQTNLSKPHQRRLQTKDFSMMQNIDVRPEIRMRTMISMSHNAAIGRALDAALAYCDKLLVFWGDYPADYRESMAILRLIESLPQWRHTVAKKIYDRIKAALLSEIEKGVSSQELFWFIDFLGSNNQEWNSDETAKILIGINHYLDVGFDEELGDCTAEDELNDLSGRLRVISHWSNLDVSVYQDQISEAIAELQSEEQDEVEEVQDWDQPSTVMSAHKQEIEIRRLFDGLRTQPSPND